MYRKGDVFAGQVVLCFVAAAAAAAVTLLLRCLGYSWFRRKKCTG